jgi:hypothetical protein
MFSDLLLHMRVGGEPLIHMRTASTMVMPYSRWALMGESGPQPDTNAKTPHASTAASSSAARAAGVQEGM